MANTLKCVACNIVIDELLAYLQNKLSVVDEESLKRICVSAFNSDEISKSKTLLFDSIPTDQRKIVRKRKGKEERDLDDIISVLKCVDPDKIPIFVARELERLPPILFDHLDCTKLLKDLTRLNAEIEEVKNTYATSKQIEELWSCMHNLKHASLPPSLTPAAYVNTHRGGGGGGGAWNIDSGPVGLTFSHDLSTDELYSQQSRNNGYSIVPNAPVVATSHNNDVMVCTPLSRHVLKNASSIPPAAKPVVIPATVPVNVPAAGVAAPTSCKSSSGLVRSAPVSPVAGTSTSKHITAPVPVQDKGKNISLRRISRQPQNELEKLPIDSKENNGWQTVNNRKKKPRYRYLGERGKAEASVSSFKAADKKMPIFITNVHVNTVESDIVDYIKAKTQVKVSLEKINMKNVSDHKAFKFLVPATKVSIFLDEKIWPEGIIFRRFVHYKNRRADTLTSAGGTLPFNYV